MAKGQAHIRRHIAQEAARIMAEDGVSDFFTAKRKAVQRLGLNDQQPLPKNSEVEAALAEYQRIFLNDQHTRHLRVLRESALEAMEFLEPFQPKLVGSVLSGTAGQHSDVNLHLFADCPEDVDHFLMNNRIPFKRSQKKYRMNRHRDESAMFPSYSFVAGEVEMELVVFPLNVLRQAPRSPVDGKAMQRAGIDALKKLLAQAQTDPHYSG